jgi:hypothetical protein
MFDYASGCRSGLLPGFLGSDVPGIVWQTRPQEHDLEHRWSAATQYNQEHTPESIASPQEHWGAQWEQNQMGFSLLKMGGVLAARRGMVPGGLDRAC